MKNYVLVGLLLIVGLVGCKDDDELTVILKQSGQLSLRLIDNEGNPVSDAEVTLSIYDGELDVQTTNAEGRVDFGELNAESYAISTEVTHGGQQYNVRKAVQVISGSKKDVEINVQEYVGSASIKAIGFDGPAVGVKLLVAAVNEDFQKADTFAEKLNLGIKGTTDTNGKLELTDLSSGYEYMIYSYESSDDYESHGGFHLEKEEDEQVTIYIY